MFNNSLDKKKLYTNRDGVEMLDIMDTMYTGMYRQESVHSVYKANRQCTMRPDYLSACLYGDEAYAEITIKSAMLSNPFALEMGDIVYAMTLDNIYNDVKDVDMNNPEGTSMYELVKRYHKYIDKDKVPEAAGSEENKVKAVSNRLALEPNISKTGSTGIVIKNGKIYFGKNKSESDAINEPKPDVNDGVPAVNTGSFGNQPENEEEEETENKDDYIIAGTIGVDDETDSLVFDIEDDVEEDFGKYAAANVDQKSNNVVLSGTKIFFTGDENQGEPGSGEPGGGEPGEGAGYDIESDIIIPTNSDVVDCARSGVSLGKFLSASVSSCK